jgi:uncharacterized membrane-anchored protein YjiN (DUF445 family)
MLRPLLRRLLHRPLLSRLPTAQCGATALLATVTALFAAVTLTGAHGIVFGYVQAVTAAAIVGGVASWFTATALFRRPLGLAIPHTALFAERNDRLADAFGNFVRSGLLSADTVAEQIRSASLVPRLAAWLSDQDNASYLAAQVADLLLEAARVLREEDSQRTLRAELTRALEAVEVAPLAGRTLRAVIAGGRHTELFDAVVSAIDRYLANHHADLRKRFERESSGWMPGPVYRLVFDRLYARLRQRLAAVTASSDDPARRKFEEWLLRLPDRLETSPEMCERGERLKREVLAYARLRDRDTSSGPQTKRPSPPQMAEPGPEAHRRLANGLTAAGRRLGSDPRLQEGTERIFELGASALADQFRDELADFVTRMTARWDATETSAQMELLLRPDLQYIRISGTLVGAGIGLALHAIAVALT